MDEFPGLLSRDFGLRPQGKAAPMSASKKGAFGSASGYGSTGGGTAFPDDLLGGGGQWSSARGDDMFFGGEAACPPPPNYASDPFFSMGPTKTGSSPAVDAGFSASMPVYDKPVYDDDDDGDIFSGLPGMKKSSSTSAAMRDHVFTPPAYEDDLLASLGGSRPASRGQSDNGRPAAASDNAFPTYGDEDLLSTLGRPGGRKGSEAATGKTSPSFGDDPLASIGGGRSSGAEKRSESVNLKHSSPPPYEDDFLAGLSGVPKRSTDEGRSSEQHVSGFDELIPGFGGSVPPKQKSAQTQSKQQDSSFSSIKSTVTVDEDPFVFFESTSSKTHSSSGLSSTPSEYRNKPSAKTEILFDDTNNFDDFMKSAPSLSPNLEINKSRTPVETTGKAAAGDPSTKAFGNIFQATASDDRSNQNMFEKPFESSEPYKSGRFNSPEINTNDSAYDASSGDNVSHNVEEPNVTDDSIWLTVSEIPLVTRPTSAPPPSRPPPPAFRSKQSPFTSQNKASSGSNSRRKVMESSFPQEGENYHSQNSHTGRPKYAEALLDDLEEFATGMPYGHASEGQPAEEENEANSSAAASAAAMKQAMDRAEAKFKHARGVRERERDMRLPNNKETLQYVTDEDEKEKESLDYEREERERKEKEQRRLEKMRELELEKERERARQAVERATREARERAAADARQRAEKAAREQAERAAVQRAQAEARERAAAEAKERAEKLAAERERERERAETETRERAAREKAAERERAEAAARERAAREKAAVEARGKAERAAVERAASEARARAQRAAVERATAQARERAASEARERAAAMAREKQQKPENDLNSFFGMGSRATSAPKERASPSGSAFDAQNQNNTKTSSVSTSSMRRPSSAVNFMDDLTSVFGTSSNDEFQEIEGEPEERRKARLEREQRARQRVAKALAEKNEREMQVQREQAERDRISDTLNIEIKRWSAGKEGNLRALLSTLQYVLWPDSGWQPVSLTDLITGASVKKVYRKATLCVHPDKVVNGTVQQKYVAEKVFDLLKEAWNKFNSEELF